MKVTDRIKQLEQEFKEAIIRFHNDVGNCDIYLEIDVNWDDDKESIVDFDVNSTVTF